MTERAPSADHRPVFRRATEADAVELARELFLAGERVDLGGLAERLGVSRSTLHRWVHTRENLLDRVLGELTDAFFAEGLVRAREHPDDGIAELARILIGATSGFPPLRAFVAREPELALQLLLGGGGAVRRRSEAGVRALISDLYPGEAAQLTGYTEVLVQVALTLEWATIAAGDEPDAERIAQIARALLAGARAGELPPARERRA